jgi:hypothetical protein
VGLPLRWVASLQGGRLALRNRLGEQGLGAEAAMLWGVARSGRARVPARRTLISGPGPPQFFLTKSQTPHPLEGQLGDKTRTNASGEVIQKPDNTHPQRLSWLSFFLLSLLEPDKNT